MTLESPVYLSFRSIQVICICIICASLWENDFRFGPVICVLHQQEAGVLSPVTDPADRSLPPGASGGEQSSGTWLAESEPLWVGSDGENLDRNCRDRCVESQRRKWAEMRTRWSQGKCDGTAHTHVTKNRSRLQPMGVSLWLNRQAAVLVQAPILWHFSEQKKSRGLHTCRPALRHTGLQETIRKQPWRYSCHPHHSYLSVFVVRG